MFLECWNKKFDAEVLKAHKEIEAEKSLYQKLLSEKRSIEDKLETLERQVKASNDGLKRNGSDLSLSSYQENGFAENVNAQSVSSLYFKYQMRRTPNNLFWFAFILL